MGLRAINNCLFWQALPHKVSLGYMSALGFLSRVKGAEGAGQCPKPWIQTGPTLMHLPQKSQHFSEKAQTQKVAIPRASLDHHFTKLSKTVKEQARDMSPGRRGSLNEAVLSLRAFSLWASFPHDKGEIGPHFPLNPAEKVQRTVLHRERQQSRSAAQ